jgi:uncharacterized membrane protein YbaN (DUF454 family)
MTKRHIKRTVHIMLAFVMLIIGIAGLILPILNGTLFIVIALILLSFEHKKTELFLQRLAGTHPKIEKLYLKLDNTMRKFFGVEK